MHRQESFKTRNDCRWANEGNKENESAIVGCLHVDATHRLPCFPFFFCSVMAMDAAIRNLD
jgi:hypothetical protein